MQPIQIGEDAPRWRSANDRPAVREYDVLRSEPRGDNVRPWAAVIRNRATGEEFLWVRTAKPTRKAFRCSIGGHDVPANTKCAYRPGLHSACKRDAICEECVEMALASMSF